MRPMTTEFNSWVSRSTVTGVDGEGQWREYVSFGITDDLPQLHLLSPVCQDIGDPQTGGGWDCKLVSLERGTSGMMVLNAEGRSTNMIPAQVSWETWSWWMSIRFDSLHLRQQQPLKCCNDHRCQREGPVGV